MDLVRKLDGLVKVSDGQDGQERTEALVAQECIVDAVDLNDGRLNEEIVFVHSAANDDLAVGGVQHLLEALELLLVDNTTVVWRVARAVRVELPQSVLHRLDECGDKLAVDECAVLADADLAGVHCLRPQQTLCGELGVGMLGDDSRVPATKLEGQRCEGLGCLLRDDLCDDL